MDITEVYHIQFDILRKATDFDLGLVPARPAAHPYPTFESHLPLTWTQSQPAIVVDPMDYAPGSQPTTTNRPDLVCQFCPRIKAFATIVGLWSHLFHKHGDIDQSSRLKEIKRTAALWRVYWIKHSDGGKGASTLAKLATAESDAFCWKDVLLWKLQ